MYPLPITFAVLGVFGSLVAVALPALSAFVEDVASVSGFGDSDNGEDWDAAWFFHPHDF